MDEQVMPFVECFLSPLLCGFWKGYNTQHALLKFLETCKITMDNGGFAGALLMDLSKAFDCLNHERNCMHMVLVEVPSRLFTAIFRIEGKGSKLMVPLARGKILT